MDESIAILGRQPTLGLAELESLYGGANVELVNSQVARLQVSPCYIDFPRLGGTIKLCKTLKVIDTTDLKQIETFLASVSPSYSERMPKGKMHLGLSAYGLETTPQQLHAIGIHIKKVISEKHKRSVRIVPNNSLELNAAQVLHNKLLTDNGWELALVRHENQTIIAQTMFIQGIESYSLRDYGRPKRDSRVGMLPPKLAQIILNLAIGPDEFTAIKPTISNDNCLRPEDNQKIDAQRSLKTLLDPFCGTGVVLQEALLAGYRTKGTDLNPRMIEYAKENLRWLVDRYKPRSKIYDLAIGDATNYQWSLPVDIVVSETYLGRPFTTQPSREVLEQTIADCDLIIKKFLRNIFQQLPSSTRLCLAVPAWQVRPRQFRHLPVIDQLSDLGYNRLRFKHAQNEDLLYYRPDQIVARELLVLARS
ncbi:MAG: TRM11 family SAM-dependent methyltransferase [Candidatus Saccharimonadales bacterium]